MPVVMAIYYIVCGKRETGGVQCKAPIQGTLSKVSSQGLLVLLPSKETPGTIFSDYGMGQPYTLWADALHRGSAIYL